MEATKPAGWIVSRTFDLFFFIGSPILALVLGEIVTNTPQAFEFAQIGRHRETFVAIFIASWTNAHLFAVVFRSHANPHVFRQFPIRFVLVPIVLFIAILADQRILLVAGGIGVLWDVYHSSMQTFGFCRIYDAKAGNPPELGRTLDIWVNHALYIGPIFLGFSFVTTLDMIPKLRGHGWTVPTKVIDTLVDYQPQMSMVVLFTGGGFLALYALAYWRMAREGVWRVSPQKIAILATTGVTTIGAWGFMSPLKAFFVTNFFHALQYFAIVWAQEKKTIVRVFHARGRFAPAIALTGFLVTVFAVGISRKICGGMMDMRWIFCFGVVTSLMHFWYDGFVWSVRRKEVQVAQPAMAA